MKNRILPLSIAISLIISSTPEAYAAAAQAVARTAPVAAWAPVVGMVATGLHMNPALDPDGALTRTLGQAQTEMFLHPSSEAPLAFVSHLPIQLAQSPESFALLAPAEQVRVLKAAVAEVRERLEPFAAALVKTSEAREFTPGEEKQARMLASAWFYLSPETGGQIRKLAQEIRADHARGLGRRIADALTGRKTEVEETPEAVAAAEMASFFASAGMIAISHLGAPGAKKTLVQEKLAPYAERFLAGASQRAVERDLGPGWASRAILASHSETFGGESAARLREPMRKIGLWTEFVAAASLAAMREVAASLDARNTRQLLAQAGQDNNLRLAIPSWHPLASSYQTVADALKDNREAPSDQLPKMGLPLFKAFGISVRADSSFLLILGFVSFSLATGMLPQAAPGLSSPVYAILGLLLAAAFYLSIVAHEYGHALVARRFGIKTRAIIMHLLGGVAVMDGETRKAGPEFLYAIAGPLVSVALSVGFALAAGAVASPLLIAILGYLSVMNAVVAVFNMLPAFPMDGGRVLRAGLTWLLKDHYRATKAAARIGQGFGWVFISLGALRMVLGDFGGVWQILIGSFIKFAASQSALHPGTELVEPSRKP